MSATVLTILAALSYTLGGGYALAGLRWSSARQGPWLALATGLGALFLTVGIGVYCAQSSRHFFSSWSENFLLISWALGLAYLTILLGWKMRALGAIILPVCVALLVGSLLITTPGAEPTPGTVGTKLFNVHILSAFLGYGLFLTACAASVAYLLSQRMLKRKAFGALFQSLPSLEKLEKAETVCAWAGFVLFTVAVGTGSRMANQAGLEAWTLEPKIWATWATWLVFLVLVVGRATGWLAGRNTAKVVVAGAILVVCTFLLAHPAMKGQPVTPPVEGPAPAASQASPTPNTAVDATRAPTPKPPARAHG